MIANPRSLLILRSEWEDVVRMRQRVQHLVVSTFTFDPSQSPTFGDVLYNLPLVLAFDVLTNVLLFAKDEGLFYSSGKELGDLLDGARTTLTWLDWQYLRDGVKSRKEVIQRAKLYGDLQCLLYIARIEGQLVAWGIIPSGESYNRVPTGSLQYAFKARKPE